MFNRNIFRQRLRCFTESYYYYSSGLSAPVFPHNTSLPISQGLNTNMNVCYELDAPPHVTHSHSKSTIYRGRTSPGAGPRADEPLPFTYAAANPGALPAPFISSSRGYIPTTPCDVTGLNGYPSHSQYFAGSAYNFSTSTYDNSFNAMPGTVNPMYIGDPVDHFAYGPRPPT